MKQRDLLHGSITKHILRLALPSIAGMFSITIFNLTDTYFVSQLGTNALAAMGFTFPVVMIVGAMASGISMGAASLLSRAKGAKDFHLMQRIATDGILLSLIFVAFVSVIGMFTMDPVFKALGADEITLPLVKQYMSVWYIFVVVAVTPPVCDSAMRASGDMMRPFIVMIIIAVMNIVLDPLLIHGYWIFPKLGIKGAAIATIVSRACGMIATLSFAHFHHKLISFKYENIKELFSSWKGILKIGVPSISVQLMPQVLRTVFTALVSSVAGASAIAAIAIGQRLESFITLIINGIGLALVPIVGQNWGAGQYDRVYEARKKAITFAPVYCLAVFILSLFLAKPAASIFTDNAEVITYSAYYLWIMIFGLIGLTIANWLSRMFTTIGRPLWSVIINIAGTMLIIVPLAYLGRAIMGYIGILSGVALGQILVGLGSMHLAKHKMELEIA